MHFIPSLLQKAKPCSLSLLSLPRTALLLLHPNIEVLYWVLSTSDWFVSKKMSFFSLVTGRPGTSGFGSASTAEQVTQGIDASNLTVLITGICMLFARSISFVWFNSQLRVSYCDKECFFFKNEYIFYSWHAYQNYKKILIWNAPFFVVVSIACLAGLSDFWSIASF